MSSKIKMQPSLFFPDRMIPIRQSFWDAPEDRASTDQDEPLSYSANENRNDQNYPNRASSATQPIDSIDGTKFYNVWKPFVEQPSLANATDSLRQIRNSDVEYGADIYEQFPGYTVYDNYENSDSLYVSPIRSGSAPVYNNGVKRSGFTPKFMDKPAINRRILGYIHTHNTPGTSPSPADMRVFSSLRHDPSTISKRAERAVAVTITPDYIYNVIIEDPEKLRLVSDETLDRLEQKFMSEISREDNRPTQEEAFVKTYLSDPEISGVFGLFRSPNNDDDFGKVFQKAVPDVKNRNQFRWYPLKK